jgi:hypothetical protein
MMVRIQPSLLIRPGVYFEINSHYPTEKGEDIKSAMEVLRNDWEASQRKGDEIARHILDWAAS